MKRIALAICVIALLVGISAAPAVAGPRTTPGPTSY